MDKMVAYLIFKGCVRKAKTHKICSYNELKENQNNYQKILCMKVCNIPENLD